MSQAPTVARFKLYGEGLPSLREALLLGEIMRQALLAQSRGLKRPPLVFLGRNPDGTPVQDDHAHAFFLPSDDDGDGRLEHIIVYAPQGFDNEAILVLARARRLWHPELLSAFSLEMEMLGRPEEMSGGKALFGPSRVWVSKTPFVLPRHPKIYGDGRAKLTEAGLQVDGPEMQLLEELKYHGLPAPVSIEPVEGLQLGKKKVSWSQFRRKRQYGGGSLGSSRGYGYKIAFLEEVQGPVALGYACHFGLGLFEASS